MREMTWQSKTMNTMLSCIVMFGVLALCSCGATDPDSSTESRALQVYGEIMGNAAQQETVTYGLRLAGHSTSPASGEALLTSAAINSYDISYQAIQSLRMREVPGSAEVLKTAFEAKRGALKVATALTLALKGDAEAGSWLDGQVSEGKVVPSLDVLKYLAKSGYEETARKYLMSQVRSDNQPNRDQAYAVLGEIDEPWAYQMLLGGFEKEHGESRKQAIIAMGRAGDSSAVKKVAKYVNTRGLIFASIEALGNIGGQVAIDKLNKTAGHDDKLVRLYSGAALLKLGETETATAVLEPLATDEDGTIRLNMAEQLAGVEGDGALALLKGLAGDADAKVRRNALIGLLDRGDGSLEPMMQEKIQDEDYLVGTVALEWLTRWGGRGTLGAIEPLLESENPYLALSAAAAVLDIIARNPVAG